MQWVGVGFHTDASAAAVPLDGLGVLSGSTLLTALCQSNGLVEWRKRRPPFRFRLFQRWTPHQL